MTSDPSDELAPHIPAMRLTRAIERIPDSMRDEVTPAIAGLLRHEDGDVRQAALRKLAVHWRDRAFLEAARAAIREDAEDHVRATAAFGLASLSQGTPDPADIALLLPVIRGKQNDPDLRIAAYEALLLMHGRRTLPPLEPAQDPDEVVDWDWLAEVDLGAP